MPRRSWTWCLGFTITLTLFAGRVSAQTCPINGYLDSRTDGGYSIINGSRYAGFRPLLTNSAYFNSATGAVPINVSLGPGVNVATGANLSETSVFFTGWTLASTYSDAEKTALRNFVLGGGNLIVQADDANHSIVEVFGLTQNPVAGGGGSTNQALVNGDHVILNGPFGRVQKLVPVGFVGQFTGVPGNAVTLVSNIPASGARSSGVVVFPEGALGSGSGRVVIINDSDYVSSIADSDGSPDNDMFMLNVFAYACGVPNIAGGNTYYFPQIAYSGGYVTRARITSASASALALGRFDVFDNDGISVADCGISSIFPNASPGGCVLSGSPAAAVRTGWARARSAGGLPFLPFFPSIQYTLTSGATLQTAVGVSPSTPGTNFTLSGPIQPNSKIALAILSLPTSRGNATVTVRAYNSVGNQVGSTGTFQLGPGGNTARFVDQIIGISAALDVGINCSVSIASTQPIAVLGLAFDTPANIFSTIPVFPGRK